MNKLMSVVMLAGVFTLPLRADDKPADAKSRQTQLQELQKDFQKAMQGEIVPEFENATTTADKNKALAKVDPFIERGLKLVAENPKDDVSFNTLMMLMGSKPERPDKVIDAMVEHQVDNPKLASLVMQLIADATPANEKRARTILEKTKSIEVKGAYFLGTAQTKFQKAEDAKDVKEKTRLFAEAEKLFERVIADFHSVELGPNTMGILAKKFLFELRDLAIGKPAPEVVSKDLDDKETKLSALKGKIVVLDIWATWCPPCRAMIPHEREMVEKLKDKPFTLISVSADDTKEVVRDFLKNEKMPWTHWFEGQREDGIISDWNVRFYPTIYVLDHKGVIRFKNVRGKDLEEAVEKLLAEQEKEKKS
jgi:thiol-disulfide isomerase/thioredoxin